MNSTISLQEQWDLLKKEQPNLRIRNVAKALGVSEVELLCLQLGKGVTRLEPKFSEILLEIESLGKVMALTRNDEAVHERKGVYLNPDFSSPHAHLFVGEDIDLRIFPAFWQSAFAVVEATKNGDRRSLQFFGKDGSAVHKIYLTPQSSVIAYEKLVEKFKSEDQNSAEKINYQETITEEKPDQQIEVAAFQKAWLDLKDTHDFFMMLKKFDVSRTQAMRLAPSDYHAQKIESNKIINALEKAAEKKIPIMVFIGNKGMIQIHSGKINKLMWHEQWYNIMDADFNMHLAMDKIESAWIVRKPTEDGVVTSIEAFNKKGELIVQFFGQRKPGIPELEDWQQTVAEL
ncbi:hemin-degrading factor [Vaginella massiliensis]|uniref:hemin-degrading factor n=1 Tax=Vaginella massiliensis TaxID=1816680 RepID=UPI00083933CE|nr:ChuX/HutX family heme-like substrate-binding protein [Vaginella massiliensis]